MIKLDCVDDKVWSKPWITMVISIVNEVRYDVRYDLCDVNVNVGNEVDVFYSFIREISSCQIRSV